VIHIAGRFHIINIYEIHKVRNKPMIE
jgi:hypothetical protein